MADLQDRPSVGHQLLETLGDWVLRERSHDDSSRNRAGVRM